MFCNHEWKVLSETTTKSQYEHAKDIGLIVEEGRSSGLIRKHIQIVSCDKCGSLKRFVEIL
jgi:hypothetical protein